MADASETQYSPSIKKIIDDADSLYRKSASITRRNKIPSTKLIPIENQQEWFRIPDVICVFADMQGSTQLSAVLHDNSTARAYQLYTGTAVKIFDDFDSPYIDVRGDGVLALFDSDQPHRALAAAVTFKTFAKQVFSKNIKDKTGLDIGSHLGIDVRTVLVRKIGFKRRDSRSDRQNEVWAGKPVNMAAKLSGVSEDCELLVSDRYFKLIKDEHGLKSCGCPGGGEKVSLWEDIDLSEDDRFDFDKAKVLKPNWCAMHGREYCRKLILADNA